MQNSAEPALHRLTDLSDLQLPKHKHLQLMLEERIRSGEWAAGTRLPTEVELMRQYGLSSTTVHRAMCALAQAGLIRRQRRSGTFVNETAAKFTLPSLPQQAYNNLAFFHKWKVEAFHPYFTALTNGLVDAAGEHDMGLQLRRFRKDGVLGIDADFREQYGVAGLIANEMLRAEIEAALDLGIPLVLLSRHFRDLAVDRVIPDERSLHIQAFRHLHCAGHKDVAVVDFRHRNDPQEYAAEVFGCLASSHPVEEIYTHDWGEEGANTVLQRLEELTPRPTALFVRDDFILLHLLRLFDRKSISVPGDLAIIGSGTPRSKDMLGSRITMMELDPRQVGTVAVGLLLEQIKEGKRPGRRAEIPYVLNIRESA